MSALKPIPAELLTDCAVLRTPTAGGDTTTDIIAVRIVSRNATTAGGRTILYCGESYEITSAELFSGTAPHHYRIKARKTDGTFRQ